MQANLQFLRLSGQCGFNICNFWPVERELQSWWHCWNQSAEVYSHWQSTAASYMHLMLNGVTSIITELFLVCLHLQTSQNSCKFEPCVAYSNVDASE